VFLRIEGLFLHLDDKAGEMNAVHGLNEPDHGEIAFAADVHTNEQRVFTV
jgi:hypothetical protein